MFITHEEKKIIDQLMIYGRLRLKYDRNLYFRLYRKLPKLGFKVEKKGDYITIKRVWFPTFVNFKRVTKGYEVYIWR